VLTHGGAVFSLAVLADGRLASGGDDGKIKLWPREGRGGPVVPGHGGGVWRGRGWGRGGWAAAGMAGTAKRWRREARAERGASALAVLADGRLASGGNDGKIKLWAKEGTGEPVVLAHGGAVCSVAVLADGRLASGGNDGNIKLWPKEGRGEPVVLAHRGGV